MITIAAPSAFVGLDQWVAWKYELRAGSDVPTKVPYNVKTGHRASSTDPTTWDTFAAVSRAYGAEKGLYDGLGFVVTAASGFVGIDLDHCVQPDGVIEPWAMAMVDTLPSYAEISPSGTGIHIYGRGELPEGRRKLNHVECYSWGRFFTVTGHHLAWTPEDVEDISGPLPAWHASVFPPVPVAEHTNGHGPLPPTSLADADVLRVAFGAKNGGAIEALWRGDTSAYGGDDSSADLALCNHLAFYAPDRIDSLFRQSGLMRPKWDERHGAQTYGQMTVGKALGLVTERYVPPGPRLIVATSNGAGHHAPPGAHLDMVRMSLVRPEPVTWLWRGRLARGKPTLVMGDPGLGKSLMTHTWAATVSVGGFWPDGTRSERGDALLFTTEDGLADTVAPRLLAAGADMDHVHGVHGVIEDPNDPVSRMFALTQHLALLEQAITDTGAILVVMDPVTAYLGPDVNSHKEADVRAVLGPLSLLAERTNVVLVMLMHLTKGSGVSALYRATGSIAFPAVARVVLGIAPDPNDDDGKRRLLLPIKMNIGKLPDGIGYRIETAPADQHILIFASPEDQPPLLVWDNDPVTIDAASAMDRTGTPAELGAVGETKAALVEILAAGPVPANECKRQIKEAVGTTSETVLSRARKELGVHVRKQGFSGGWTWELTAKAIPHARVDSLPISIAFDSQGAQNGAFKDYRTLSNPIEDDHDLEDVFTREPWEDDE